MNLNKIIEEEKEAFEKNFMNNGINGILEDKFQDTKILLIRSHINEYQKKIFENLVSEIEKIPTGMFDSTPYKKVLLDKLNTH